MVALEERLCQQMSDMCATLEAKHADCKAALESKMKAIESRMGRRSEIIYSVIGLCSSVSLRALLTYTFWLLLVTEKKTEKQKAIINNNN